MPIRKFSHHHDQLVSLAESILGMAKEGSPDALQKLQLDRIALSRTIAEHCSAEIAHITPPSLEMQADAQKTALIRKYHSELLAWRGALMECNANWPTRRIASEPAGFIAVFGKLAADLRARVRWEEEQFYPAIFGKAAVR